MHGLCPTYAFFVKAPDNEGGNCRRNPPTPYLVPGPPNPLNGGKPNIMLQGFWPPVGPMDYCGRHELRVSGPAEPIDQRLTAEAEGEA